MIMIGETLHRHAGPATALDAATGAANDVARDAAIPHDVFLATNRQPRISACLYPTMRQDGSTLQTMYRRALSARPCALYDVEAGGGRKFGLLMLVDNGTRAPTRHRARTQFVKAPILADPDRSGS